MEYAFEPDGRRNRKKVIPQRKKSVIPKVIFILVIGAFIYEFMYKPKEIPNLIPETILEITSPYAVELTELSAKYPNAAIIAENIDNYPLELIDLAIRNNEAIDFVADFPNDINDRDFDSIDISDDYKAGAIPYFIQWDRRWGYSKYGDSKEFLAISGCGPTSLAMVVVGLTGNKSVNPKTISDYSYDNGYFVEDVGTSWTLMSEGAKAFGLNVREVPLDYNTMAKALKNGEIIIASMGPGEFTEQGHFIVLTGIDNTGNFIIKDANSPLRTAQAWDYDVFKSETKNLWAFSSNGSKN